jgi:nucleoside-diphosphate-sugar epimerase
VVFDGSDSDYVDESSPANPFSLYGQAKFIQEMFVNFQIDNHGLDATIYRLPGVFDSRSKDPRFLRYFADCVRNKQDLIYHLFDNGSASVPLTSVKNVISELYDSIMCLGDNERLVHLSDTVCNATVIQIASTIAAKYSLNLKPAMIKRSVFSGNFDSNRTNVNNHTEILSPTVLQDLADFVNDLIQVD